MFPQLESGHVPDRQMEINHLNAEIARLREQLSDAREEVSKNQRAVRALAVLRTQLNPLYKALGAIFGELDSVGVADDGPGPSRPVPPVWQSWQQKFGQDSAAARFIQALLEHGEMNVPQLRVHMKAAQQTVYDTATKLNKLGLLTKNGGRYALRQL